MPWYLLVYCTGFGCVFADSLVLEISLCFTLDCSALVGVKICERLLDKL